MCKARSAEDSNEPSHLLVLNGLSHLSDADFCCLSPNGPNSGQLILRFAAVIAQTCSDSSDHLHLEAPSLQDRLLHWQSHLSCLARVDARLTPVPCLIQVANELLLVIHILKGTRRTESEKHSAEPLP